jgi:hypothetical protein
MSRSIAALSAETSFTDGTDIVETKRSLPDRAESSSRAGDGTARAELAAVSQI